MNTDDSIIRNLNLEQALGNIPSGLFVVDQRMRIVYWNPAAARITGFSAEEAIGRPCSFLQGVPCGESCGLYNPAVKKPVIGANCTIVTKQGQTIHLLKNIDYLRNDAGEIIGGIESFIDVSRQHSLEMSLREQAATLEERVRERTAELNQSETRFRTVLDNMDDMAYISTGDFRLSFMNRAMQERFGDRVGELCYEVLHQFPEQCPWCTLDKLRDVSAVREERHLGDRNRLYEILHSALPDENGKQQKLAVCRDITERKKVETDLKEANRELDAFAHSVSHDLRGILSPVVTYMDFLRMTYREVFDDQVLQILAEVERQSERAIDLLDDLLDLAQVSHVKPSNQLVDVNTIVAEIEHDLRLERSKKIEIASEDLPETWLPEILVYQVFSNLISNAYHYAPEGCGAIEIGSRDDNDRVIYFVRDHGPGIPAAERDIVFEIFHRGENAKDQRGTGVGLAIVRKIALRCRGMAWAEQTPGGGATLCVALPKEPAFGLNPAGTL